MVAEESENGTAATTGSGDYPETASEVTWREQADEEEGVEEVTATVWRDEKQSLTLELSRNLIHRDLDFRIEAAREIRKSPVKSSARSKLADAGVIPPLVSMLVSSSFDARHASLLALLNLAVRNERAAGIRRCNRRHIQGLLRESERNEKTVYVMAVRVEGAEKTAKKHEEDPT